LTSPLFDPLRHNAWGTRQLLAFCRRLDPSQLDATATGTYGSILATLQHLIGAEHRYRKRLAGEPAAWAREPEETDDLAELTSMAEDMAAYWDSLLKSDFDPDRVIAWTSADSGAHTEVAAGMLIAQLLNHGNEHRSQVCTVLTEIGVEPPELDGWSYGIVSGRFTEDPVVHTVPTY
jgi:uncharacterized damage-inducible protein DinB